MNGGGPIAAAIGYWATKALCYGVAVAGASTIVVATGGVAGAVTGVIAAATTGASAGAGLAGDTALATTAVTSTMGIAEAVAAVESASIHKQHEDSVFSGVEDLPILSSSASLNLLKLSCFDAAEA
jgi:hypothetical protein